MIFKMEHLEKISQAVLANLAHQDDCEYGSIGTDCKRPFGNSYVEGDVLELIGAEPEGDDGYEPCFSSKQLDYARQLYDAVPAYMRKRYLVDRAIIAKFQYQLKDEAL